MHFAHPQVLWLLLVFPPGMLFFFWWTWRQRQQLMTQFIQARLLPALTVGLSPARQKLRFAGLILAVVCLILALARPQWGFAWEEARIRGLDIVVGIDTSKSMLARDIAPNRLARAKLAALDLMQRAKSDRLGLVAFAGSAFLQCPLTIDDAAFRQSVEMLDVKTIPEGGTALADAIDTALTAFKEGDNHKVLVLLTDGEDHDSGAVEAAKRAGEAGLRIFTVGIGTAEGEILPDTVRDEQGNVVKSRLDENTLREIASKSAGGFYLPLRGAKTIDTLYDQGLATLPKSEHQEKLIKRYYERFHWPLAIAIVLLAAEMLLPERKRQSRNKPAAASAKAPLAQAAAVLVLVLIPAMGFGSAASALREYKAGKYDQAQKEFERLLERKADDPRLHFNAGTAAYRNQQYGEAAKQFDEALSSTAPDLNLQGQAYYNRGNTYYYLGEQAPDPSKRSEAWKKSVQDFESSLKLNPKDQDAKFNREFVKKRLEELKQQQQQNQQNKSDQKQDQDQNQQQQNQQNQQSKDQQDQNQQNQKQDQQQQEQQPQDGSQQKQQQAQQQEQQQQQQQAAKQSAEQQDKQQQQAAAQAKDQADEKEQEATPAGQMTPQQARRLLDAQKDEEKMLPIQPNSKGKPSERSRQVKDW